MKCFNCGSEQFQKQPVDIQTKVGERTVVHHGQPRNVCCQCGEFTVSATMLEKLELRAALVAFSDAPKVTGPMLRFARKALGFTQPELAQRIGASTESVSRWEREERPSEPWVPLAVTGLIRERLMPNPPNVELLAS